MKAVCFSFDDFNLVIHPFDFTGVNLVITMIQDAVSMSLKHFYKAGNRWMIKGSCHSAPAIERLGCPSP